jgi:hypothetical protein
MADHPDLYADNIAISANPFGVTLTLTRSEPGIEPGADNPPNEIVGRVRMSHDLARAMTELVIRTLAQANQANQAAHQTTTEVKH